MRSLFGVVGVLVVLAVVLFVARQQLQAVGLSTPAPPESESATPATVQDTARGVQQKVQSDVTRALEQGAARAAEPQQ